MCLERTRQAGIYHCLAKSSLIFVLTLTSLFFLAEVEVDPYPVGHNSHDGQSAGSGDGIARLCSLTVGR